MNGNGNEDWKKDLSWSARAFVGLVWPHLQNHLDGELVHVEAITRSDFARDLDAIAGIDAWNVVDGRGIRGIASRVQVSTSHHPFNTFTIRRSRDSGATTEYEKRKNAIESDEGWIYPFYTVQSYITKRENGELRSFAIAKTEEIIAKIDEWELARQPNNSGHWTRVGMRASNDFGVWTNRTDNAEFYVVDWRIAFVTFHADSSSGKFQIELPGMEQSRIY